MDRLRGSTHIFDLCLCLGEGGGRGRFSKAKTDGTYSWLKLSISQENMRNAYSEHGYVEHSLEIKRNYKLSLYSDKHVPNSVNSFTYE